MKLTTGRHLKIQYVAVGKLRANPKNPRSIGDAAFQRLCASLREDPEYFSARPLLANRDFVVFAGNQRLRAAIEIGLREVPVVIMHNPELEATRMLKDNIASGEWDFAMLHEDFDLEFLREVGFSDDDLARVGEHEALLDEDDLDLTPPVPEKATSKLGDLWLLGDHRLLCGDSATVEDVDRLMSGAQADLLNTDPVYNVNVEPRSRVAILAAETSGGLRHHQGFDLARARKRTLGGRKSIQERLRKPSEPLKLRAKDRPLVNDFVDEAKYAELLRAWCGNAARVMRPGASYYMWGGYSNFANYPSALKEAGLFFSQLIVWKKGHPVLTRKDYMGDAEFAFYGWREGAAHRFFGPNNVADIWDVQKVAPQRMVHTTEKPVELALRAIRYSSLKGEVVLDLFGGSGSTLIAAEHTGRRAYLMEIDPLYVDVIVKRYETLTGKKAVLAKE